jgi:hypothetical protein
MNQGLCTLQALGAIRTKDSALAARYRRVMRHRGHEKAVVIWIGSGWPSEATGGVAERSLLPLGPGHMIADELAAAQPLSGRRR